MQISKTKMAGFSLLEMIIAVAIFALVAVAVMSAYVSIFKAGKNAKIIQQNMENARVAMDNMAKTIRSGEIDSSSISEIKVFVYNADSDSLGKCVKFSFNSNNIQESQTATSVIDRTVSPYPYCSTATYVNTVNLVDTSLNFTITGKFKVVPVLPAAAGRVTILADVQSGMGSANLQTTVSLSGSKEVSPN